MLLFGSVRGMVSAALRQCEGVGECCSLAVSGGWGVLLFGSVGGRVSAALQQCQGACKLSF